MRPLFAALLCTALAPLSAPPVAVPAAERVPAGADASAGMVFRLPLAGPPEVARPLESPGSGQDWYGPGHRGVDLLGTVGEQVLAAGTGHVLFAGQLAGRSVVSIEHTDGLRTTYEPIDPLVEPGERVTRAQPIGWLQPGHPGCHPPPGRACLHWGVRRGGAYLDPLRLLGQGAVRLLPWPPDLIPLGRHGRTANPRASPPQHERSGILFGQLAAQP